MSSCENSEIQRQFAGIVQGIGGSMRSSNRSNSMPPSPSGGSNPAPPVYPNPTQSPMALSAVQPRSSSTPPRQQLGFRNSAPPNLVSGSPRALLMESSSRAASPYQGMTASAAQDQFQSSMGSQPPLQSASQFPTANRRSSAIGQLDYSLYSQPPSEMPPAPLQPPPPSLAAMSGQPAEVPRFSQHASLGTVPVRMPPTKGAAPSMSVYGKQLDVMEMFPALFTAFCLATFMTPIVLSFHIGRDPQVLFWIGNSINWVVYLPVLYVGSYAYHTHYRLPSKMVMVVCLIGSCVTLLVLCDRVLLAAYDRANEFAARDCDTFPTKRQLQREWENARTFYTSCVAAIAEENSITREAAYESYRIRDCPEYEAQLTEHPHWEYLGQLEDQQHCSGWCERAQPLWVGGTVKDSCSAVVADIMMNKVQWTMMQVLVYTLCVLAILSALLVGVAPRLWRYTAEQKALMRDSGVHM